ncbi:actin family [Thamnocephalis sphaerospora]|uniref:Actin family n=1 Tax=Thamnocephalis sphaerospora TaxID=78915 RepID=A0A4P9XGX0_9FUNG|nr:actin family [Thamnocephalis sphaerospora]|eukprot:RKP04882.1 actin family [Thamnocephalis sphaerospora]
MFREENIVIIECGSRYFRVSKGVGDPTRQPLVPQLSALAVPQEVRVPQNGENTAGSQDAEALASEFVCGGAAEQVLSRPDAVHQPIQRGRIVDWERFAAICDHALFRELGCRRATNNSPVLLCTPAYWSKRDRERLTQLFFERFNVPAFMIAEQPLLALYGVGSVTGVAIDIGYETTDVTPVIDGFLQRHAMQTLCMGVKDLDAHLEKLLRADDQVQAAVGADVLPEFIQQLKSSGHYTVAPTAADIARTEREDIEFRGGKVSVGSARCAFAEPLFAPELIEQQIASLPEAVHAAITVCDADKRVQLSECLILTGGGSLLPGLRERLEAELATLFACGETIGDMQVSNLRFVGAPDYLGEYREHPELFGFLGGIILGKVAVSDSKNFVTKTDYNERGPSAIHAKNP